MNRSALCAILGAMTLAACASPQPGSPGWTAQQEQKKQEVRAETVKASVDDLPSWYTSPSYSPGRDEWLADVA